MFVFSVSSFSSWREAARPLLLRNIHPHDVVWQHQDQSHFDFGADLSLESLPLQRTKVSIPADFVAAAREVACHKDPKRWSLLYRISWRLIFEDRQLLCSPIDEDVAQLRAMQKGISRAKHKMKAFVRFQEIEPEFFEKLDPKIQAVIADKKKQAGDQYARDEALAAPSEYVAWFEPEHNILEALAPFFVKRFTNMRWSIFTPLACARWDTDSLKITHGEFTAPKCQDALEDLWLAYYRNIFNPARLKVKAMQSEMPKKYWRNLPEASLIEELSSGAESRTSHMIEKQAAASWKKTQHSRMVQTAQKALRTRRASEQEHKN